MKSDDRRLLVGPTLKPAWLGCGLLLLLVAMTFPAAAAALEPGQGLVLSWHLDETSGLTAADGSGHGYNGTLMNYAGDDSQWVAGRMGGALAMNNNYVEATGLPTLNSTTWAAWVKLTTTSLNYDAVISAGFTGATAGHSLGFHTGATALQPRIVWNHNVGAAIIQSPTPVVGSNWNHLALTYDAGTKVLKLYVNGAEKASSNNVATTEFSSINVGRRQASQGNPLRGVVDEVKVYDRALSLPEIQQLADLMVAGPPRITQPPVALNLYEGQNGSFSVKADGLSPMTFQWRKNGQALAGETNLTLSLTNVLTAQAGDYSVAITNIAGGTVSEAAKLTVTMVTNINVGMKAQWKFDETGGWVAADATGNGNPGQLTDYADETSQWVPGKVGKALLLDGFANRVVVSDSPSLSLGNEASFSFWLKPDTYGSERSAGTYNLSEGRIIRKGGNYDLYTSDNPGGPIKTVVANGVAAPFGSLTLSNWQHFAVVFRSGTVAFYKNGFPLGTPQAGALGAVNSNLVTLGNYDETLNTLRLYQGTMDEVGVWDRPLSESEILELSGKDASGRPAIDTPPQSLTKLEGTSAEFTVLATGKRPITYQWLHNGQPITGATNNQLALATLTAADAGAYSVVVSNALGQVTSDPVPLVVQEIREITTGLLGYWNFDETSGTILHDASGHGLNATLQGNPAVPGVTGTIGGAFNFDGFVDFAMVPHTNLLNLTDDGTISVWINPVNFGSVAGGYGRILRKTVNYDMALFSDSQTFRFAGFNKIFIDAPTNSVELNAWQHLAIVLRSGSLEFFKNGQSLGPAVPAKVNSVNTDPLVIGNFQGDLAINRLFTGLMDDLGLWNRALSPREINGIYQNGLAGQPLTANFQPLEIRSFSWTGADKLKLTFYTPYNNKKYTLQRKDNLGSASWTDQPNATPLAQGQGMIQFEIGRENLAAVFYRIVALPE